jgi:hypothetical protein
MLGFKEGDEVEIRPWFLEIWSALKSVGLPVRKLRKGSESYEPKRY